MKNIFVTVGTTCFDKLVETITSDTALKTLNTRGFTDMLLQIGSGRYEPPTGTHHGISVSFYRKRNSIAADIAWADLVVGHCGAGTCLETVGAGKCMVAVINDQLMDNHQQQLARRLAADGCLLATSCQHLNHTLVSMSLDRMTRLSPPKTDKFAHFLDHICQDL